MRGRRKVQAELMVIGALSQNAEPLTGYELMQLTRMSSGRVYGTLIGLQNYDKVERIEIVHDFLVDGPRPVFAYRLAVTEDVNHAVIVRELDGALTYYPMPEEVCQHEAVRWKSYGHDVLGIAVERHIG